MNEMDSKTIKARESFASLINNIYILIALLLRANPNDSPT